MNCKNCRANCTEAKQDREFTLCLGYVPPKTEGDRVRAMTDEELAEFITKNCACRKYNHNDTCYTCWLDWLKQEVDKEDEADVWRTD